MEQLGLGLRSQFTDTMAATLEVFSRGRQNMSSSAGTKRELFVPHPSLIRMLREFLGQRLATFKNPEQAEALEVVMAGDRHVLLVGPTAMGKSLVYMLPATRPNCGITCVLLPLSALHLDFARRCRDLKIESSQWMPFKNEQPKTKIVYVSPKHAQTTGFIKYLIKTSRQGKLARIVVDEVHLVKSHADFRFCFSALRPLISAGESARHRNQIYFG